MSRQAPNQREFWYPPEGKMEVEVNGNDMYLLSWPEDLTKDQAVAALSDFITGVHAACRKAPVNFRYFH